MVDTAAATLESFATRLRTGTRDAHERAEESGFVVRLIAGELDAFAHASLLAQLHPVYAALEAGAERLADDPDVAPFLHPGLVRLPAIESDLAGIVGADWRSRLPVLPTARAYAARIDRVAAEWPAGFVAHHYTRYLGDLAGGQAIRVAVRRHYGLAEDHTRFFAFDDLGPVPAFRAAYRDALEAVAWSPEEQDRAVAEAVVAFRHNLAVFESLATAGGR